jgi:phage shock protein E
MRALPIALLAAALAVTGCSAGTADPATVEAVESPAPGTVAVVPAEQFAAAAEQPGVVLIDVRTPQEYADGHIDGARNIDLNSPDFTAQIAELDPTVTYAVYCRSGNRSATATAYMLQQGFAPPYELGGGIVAWESAGLPVA